MGTVTIWRGLSPDRKDCHGMGLSVYGEDCQCTEGTVIGWGTVTLQRRLSSDGGDCHWMEGDALAPTWDPVWGCGLEHPSLLTIPQH